MRPDLLTMAMLATTLAAAAWADDTCSVPMADWQPRAAVEALARAEGWTIRRLHVDDGCYELDGWDRKDAGVEITLDPTTLAVVGSTTRTDGPAAVARYTERSNKE